MQIPFHDAAICEQVHEELANLFAAAPMREHLGGTNVFMQCVSTGFKEKEKNP